MSTGTAHLPEQRPDARHPDRSHPEVSHPEVARSGPSHPDDLDRATTRVVLVSIVATLAVAWSLVLVFAAVSQNGLHLGVAQALLAAFAIAVIPGLLAAWAVHLEGRAWEGTSTRFVVLVAVCVVLMMCGVAIVATFGAQAYDDGQGRVAATSVTAVDPG